MREPQQPSRIFRHEIRALLALVLAALVAGTPAHGLVRLRFNDGHDQVNVSVGVGVSRDSNVFASKDSKGDFLYSTDLLAEYTRRAGWIGVNASVGVSSSHFATVKGQDFANPTFSAELTKQSGRTTGSLTMSATRQSRADAATNLRSTSWSYQTGLNFAYPIIERFKLAGQFGYSGQKQVDNTSLVNLATYSAGMNLFYVYNTERDLSAGYRYRYTQTSRSDSTTDHNFSGGMSGRIIRGLNGSINVGYQFRVPHSATNKETFHGVSASAATQYALNRKMSLTGQVSKDFSTTSTDASVDTGAADLGFKYAYSSKWSLLTGVGVGDSRFLGAGGRILLALGPPPEFGPQRHDTFMHADATLSYARTERFKVSFTYGWFKNWSTIPFADFVRSSWNLRFDSRL
jgi:hypothetical protein